VKLGFPFYLLPFSFSPSCFLYVVNLVSLLKENRPLGNSAHCFFKLSFENFPFSFSISLWPEIKAEGEEAHPYFGEPKNY